MAAPTPALPPNPDVEASLGLPLIDGIFDLDQVFAGVIPIVGSLSSCFPMGRDWEGEVLVRAVVTPSGAVGSSQVATTTLSTPGVERCLADHVAKASFPADQTRGDVTVVLPLNFYRP